MGRIEMHRGESVTTRAWLWIACVVGVAPPLSAQQPRRPEPKKPPGSAASQLVVKRQVNINTASELQLQLLPGITSELSASIIAYRQAHGGFDVPSELRHVPGLDEEVWRRLEPFATTKGPTTTAVQSDLGALTAAQAIIFACARVALGQSLPLLDGPHPLQTSADLQALEAVRRVTRVELTELLTEFGRQLETAHRAAQPADAGMGRDTGPQPPQ